MEKLGKRNIYVDRDVIEDGKQQRCATWSIAAGQMISARRFEQPMQDYTNCASP